MGQKSISLALGLCQVFSGPSLNLTYTLIIARNKKSFCLHQTSFFTWRIGCYFKNLEHQIFVQVLIAHWLARQLATGEVWGSNPGKGQFVKK